MKTVNILILDDNFVIAKKIKKRLFDADFVYRRNTNIQLIPHYLHVDNVSYEKAAVTVNSYVLENNIHYLLLDRGFGTIIEPKQNDYNFDYNYIYKDNAKGGYYIENLLLNWKSLKNSSIPKINGAIVYTYDDYRELNKQGDVIKQEIEEELKRILPKKCKIDVLLAYTDIYKIAEVDLYMGYAGEGVIKLGKKNEFHLYGIFVGELLYHKLIQMIAIRRVENISESKMKMFFRMLILYAIFISISVGGNAVFTYLFADNKQVVGFISLAFGLIVPLIILFLKPTLLLDIGENEI
jgi:hypothetical protein